MTKALAAIGLRGKSGARADEHDDDKDEEAKRVAEEEEKEKEAEAKAQEDEEEKEAKAEDDEDEKQAKAVARAAKAASAKASAKAHEIAVLCKVAKSPDLTDEFIASGASPAAVGERLLELRADASGTGEIAGQTSPAGSPAAADAMWDHAIERNTRAGTAGVDRK